MSTSFLKAKMHHSVFQGIRVASLIVALMGGVVVASCAPMQAGDPRSVDIPPPTPPEDRRRALNAAPDSILVVPLGRDVLVPLVDAGDPLPTREVGPFELRNQNLAGALQLILSDYDVPLAFETQKGMTTGVTVANLRGPLDKVVEKVCSLADMYCLYDDGILTVKESQTFTVSLPPLPPETTYDSIVSGLQAFTGTQGVIDTTTRTMIYSATARTSRKAEQYFARLRKSTAMIVYETYIWEVGLSGGNSAGISWSKLNEKIGAFNVGFAVDQAGAVLSDLGTPISIGLPTRGTVNMSADDILKFITTQGAVKTISQPQLTVISGAEATMRVAEREAYVASLTRTQNNNNDSETVSTTTGQVDTGFTLTIGSSWDDGTVYGNIEIELQQLLEFQDFPAGDSSLRLPKTAEREVKTQVRVRPGDSVLIAGLVRERQQYDKSGIGSMAVNIPSSRTGTTQNTELVFLLRPRVIVYKPIEEIEAERRYMALSAGFANVPDAASIGTPEGVTTQSIAPDVHAPRLWEDVEAEEAKRKEATQTQTIKPPRPVSAAPSSGTRLSPDMLDPALGER